MKHIVHKARKYKKTFSVSMANKCMTISDIGNINTNSNDTRKNPSHKDWNQMKEDVIEQLCENDKANNDAG